LRADATAALQATSETGTSPNAQAAPAQQRLAQAVLEAVKVRGPQCAAAIKSDAAACGSRLRTALQSLTVMPPPQTLSQASEAWERSAAATAEVETAVRDCNAASRALAAVLAVAAVSGGHGDLDVVLQEGTAALAAIERIAS
jgi:hypothetical protein